MLINIGRKYADALRRVLTLQSLYVFGSYATGQHDEDSDIDIAREIMEAGIRIL